MTETTAIMGLFEESTQTADAIDALYGLGVPEDDIVVMSGVPYPEQALGRSSEWIRLPYIVLAGAIAGFFFGVFLSVVTPLLYPLSIGGRPLVTGPPSAVIIFVFTMMATIISTFLGVLWEMGFPTFAHKYYHQLVTSGYLAVVLEVPENIASDAERILTDHGGSHIHRPEKTAL